MMMTVRLNTMSFNMASTACCHRAFEPLFRPWSPGSRGKRHHRLLQAHKELQPVIYLASKPATEPPGAGPSSCGQQQTTSGADRRAVLLGAAASVSLVLYPPAAQSNSLDGLEAQAFEAYASQDFRTASQALTSIIQADPNNPRWFEMRAQVLVDGKNFPAALEDFATALKLTPETELTARARLYAGRALAEEGLGQWQAALDDYTLALDVAYQGGESPDPYIVNSRGNCYNSLGLWKEARDDYLVSSQLFQQAKGFRGRGGSTTARLDGAIFAASNAALMLAQMGDEEGAVKEMERIARRAPGSVDMRAALASLYWAQGRPAEAEDQWEFACDKIVVGCSKYQDSDWLTRIRRWPPSMAEHMAKFLALKQG